jgi:hypothetical protein
LVYFPRFGIFSTFWYVLPIKIWQPCSDTVTNVSFGFSSST